MFEQARADGWNILRQPHGVRKPRQVFNGCHCVPSRAARWSVPFSLTDACTETRTHSVTADELPGSGRYGCQ
eukprot:2057045-Pyramimonas_sp.AAC.1